MLEIIYLAKYKIICIQWIHNILVEMYNKDNSKAYAIHILYCNGALYIQNAQAKGKKKISFLKS